MWNRGIANCEHLPAFAIRVVLPGKFCTDGQFPEGWALMDSEMKQRLSRTSISSDMDIDRITKESKTTTITEARETIYFRPRQSSSRKDGTACVLDAVPEVKRLSIMDSQTDEKRMQPEFPVSEVDGSGTALKQKATDSTNELVANYEALEKELKDINETNNELRKKFFKNKNETPILGTPSSGPVVSSRIQEWNCSSSKPVGSMTREKKKLSFITPTCELNNEKSAAVVQLSPTQDKQNDCSFNYIDRK
ncbi:unnamed protein product [Angiostrongylus costaricensis]|uniref:Mitotic checkpoint serine/threonine-protein kinase BUB1 n=1 Tax=Angiostrongylus costaricensis TaxID=334426 RepID=A0A0R3PP46_ANGCS|nr:unnamed protein product [Angiostrongylus costaricensis]